jgi:hypothetical protein
VEVKAAACLDAGACVVLVVDPQFSTIRCYRSPERIAAFSRGVLNLSDVPLGFRLDVCAMFAQHRRAVLPAHR